MRLTLIILALILTMANALAMAQEGADTVSSEHHATVDHSDHHDEPNHQEGLLAHHCCHSHAHVFILPQADPSFVQGEVSAWVILGTPSPRLIGYAPPVPPPKA